MSRGPYYEPLINERTAAAPAAAPAATAAPAALTMVLQLSFL